MLAWLEQSVLGFVTQYGYAAVFVYMVLETSFVLHFVPSEVVVPFAASQLVHGPASFALFVADATAGSTAGSLLAYVLFGRYGREVLERYGHLVHVGERELDRSEALFVRYGESSVLWARLLPFFRALISIPAGLAEMDLRRFLLYSTAGAGLFNTALTYLVYTGSGRTSPLSIALRAVGATAAEQVAYVRAHTQFVVVVVGALCLLALAAWLARDRIRENPQFTATLTLHAVRIVGVVVGLAFVAGALSAPVHAFGVVTSVWDDPLALVRLGFSERVALLLVGVLVALCAALVYEVGRLVEFEAVGRAVERARERIGR